MMSIRNHLISLQKRTFLSLKQEILDLQRFEPRDLKQYRQIYLSEVKSYESLSSKKDLFDSISQASIVFCGDFHTLSRSQYTAIKLLEFLIQKGKSIQLALEMIPRAVESIANDYVAGLIDEETFLKLIHYEHIWGFPWLNYKPFFDLAKHHRMSILGINTQYDGYNPLAIRDEHAAKAIAYAHLRAPESIVFCLYGDLHVAQAHIPKACAALFQQAKTKPPTMVTVYQNSDDIYWKLVEKELIYDVDVVKVQTNQFCILNTAPWIKWQSYQTWSEDHIALLEPSSEESWEIHHAPDYFHKVLMYVEKIKNFLRIDVPDLGKLCVYTSDDMDVHEIVGKSILDTQNKLPKALKPLLDTEMIENRSLFLPQVPLIFLQDVSINRMSQKASQWVAYQLTSGFRIYSPNFSDTEHFLRLVLIECLGYFGSKIINPKQKTSHIKDFERFLARIEGESLSDNERIQKQTSHTVISIFDKIQQSISHRRDTLDWAIPDIMDPQNFFLSARAVGKVLGDQLYRLVLLEDIKLEGIVPMYQSFASEKSVTLMVSKLVRLCYAKGLLFHESKDDFF